MGLTEQQARAYLALLDVDTATVNDLARPSRVPRAKLYEVLEALGHKGLLETIPGTPQRFRANPLTALYDTRTEELRAEERQLKRTIGDLMLQLMPGGKDNASDPDHERDFLHIAKGRTVMVSTLRRAIENTRTSLTIVGDRLFVPRLRLYEDLYNVLCRLAATRDVLVLVPSDAVMAVDGRKVHIDELVDHVRAMPFEGGDVALLVRDQEEIIEIEFVPNDLHPTRGSDRVIVNRAPAFAAHVGRIAQAAARTAGPLRSGLTAARRD